MKRKKDLTKDTILNAQSLRRRGTIGAYDVDVTRIEKSIRPCLFDTVVFQFPNVGILDPKYGHNPNHVLICKFLRVAASYLKPDGQILITAVDSPHYQGAFQFEDAAEFARFDMPMTYPFDPSLFSSYDHVNTNDYAIAIEEHSQFTTWVFKAKND